ncbi:hypothetical protein WJX81_007521 [Elliptochloris bilobata]|uniref:Inositol-1,3,4-trisphosphate 5/6-kinase n=1 Tax=Elliptochloris bilobata TaxID=381761 RepID=A0AAW1RN40_9CHLO
MTVSSSIRAVIFDASALAALLESGTAAADLEALHLLLLGGIVVAVVVQAGAAVSAAHLLARLHRAGLPPAVRVHVASLLGMCTVLRAAAESMGVLQQHCMKLAERGLLPLAAADGVSFVRLNLGAPVAAQGPYDAVLLKASDELEPSSCGSEPAFSAWLRALEARMLAQQVCVIDPLPAISQVLDRWALHGALERVQAAAAERGLPLRVPPTARLEALDAGAGARLAEAGVRFPLVLKPAFVAHSGIMHKVYVIGQAVRICEKASLPDPAVQAPASVCVQEQPEPVVFDSQHMGTRAAGSGLAASSSAAGAPRGPVDCALMHRAAALVQQELRLRLFGFDVLVESATGVHYIVDVNHFPSFSEVTDAGWALRGEVLFTGGTDWQSLGRGGGGKKKTDAANAAQDRQSKYPNINVPMRLSGLQDVRVRFIAAGNSSASCIAGAMDGRCFTWGRNERGQLGHGDQTQRNVPTVVEALAGKSIVSGSGGKNHSAVLTDDGHSYTFGSNLHGQCGTGSVKSTTKNEELFLLPVRALVEKCASVACGAEFTMWLTEEGRLLSAGLPQFGQLGHGTDNEYNAKDSSVQLKYAPQPTPTAISKLAHTKIVKFACGANHSLALDDKGAAFTWGNGGYGRLGHSVQQDEFSPRQVETLKGRMPADPSGVVACGAASSFCCIVGSQLMAWGKLKTTDNTMYPKAFQDLSGWNVRTMACGASTYAVAASAGGEESTITWGQAHNGELGYGASGKKSSANPGKCMALEGAHVVQVALGIGHGLFLADPEHKTVKAAEVYTPAVLEEAAPAAPEASAGAAKGRGKGAAAKRKADTEAAKPKRGKKA